jgi:hypothetical protein
MEDYKIGNEIALCFDKQSGVFKNYVICGVSTMIYDEDCAGEPEWKHTKEIQEIAVIEPFEGDRIFAKPSWIKVKDLPDYQSI